MYKRLEKNLPYYLLSLFLLVFVILAWLSEGSVGGADDLTHYRFSRYAFRFPEFFLDPWAKPLFTIVMAPFAQLGMMRVRLLNIVLGLATAFSTYLTARELDYKYPILAIFLLVCAPMYGVLMISGMTEVLFSFMLILGSTCFSERG